MNSVQSTLENLFFKIQSNIFDFVPLLLGALISFVIGWIVAKFLKKFCIKVFSQIGINKLGDYSGVHESLIQFGVKQKLSDILAQLIYLLSLLIVLTMTAEILKFEKLSQGITQFIAFLPNVFAAMMMLLGGMILANFISSSIQNVAENSHFEQGHKIAKMIKILILTIFSILALSQMQIETDLLRYVVIIVLVSVTLIFSIAIGTGSIDVAKNIVSGLYMKEIIEVGDYIKFMEEEGEVIQISSLGLLVQKSNNEILHLPNSKINSSILTKIKRSSSL